MRPSLLVHTGLLTLNEKILHKDSVLSIVKKVLHNKPQRAVLDNLRRSKRLIYILNGYYYVPDFEEIEGSYLKFSIKDMVFSALNKIGIKWCVGLYSSLEYNNVLWQAHNKTIILNESFSKTKRLLGTNFEFRKMKKDYFFGMKKSKTRNGITFFYPEINKATLDFMYFQIPVPSELKNMLDAKTFKAYLRKYPKSQQRKMAL